MLTIKMFLKMGAKNTMPKIFKQLPKQMLGLVGG
jgi:hypothetical protein